MGQEVSAGVAFRAGIVDAESMAMPASAESAETVPVVSEVVRLARPAALGHVDGHAPRVGIQAVRGARVALHRGMAGSVTGLWGAGRRGCFCAAL